MTALSWTFLARQGTVVHVANQTTSNTRTANALCGNRFERHGITQTVGRHATCYKCRKLDDPFHTGQVPWDPTRWMEVLAGKRAGQPNARSALLTRDLVTTDGVITPRGLLLSRDLTDPTPWVDDQGITHARLPAGNRGRGACGADLLGMRKLAGTSTINYDRLSKARATYEDAVVDCMSCLVLVARTS